jgi:hypothetical protein
MIPVGVEKERMQNTSAKCLIKKFLRLDSDLLERNNGAMAAAVGVSSTFECAQSV